MIFGIGNVVLELNGHVVEGGFSDDADSLMFDPIDLVGSTRTGAGGDKAYFSAGDKGGGFTLKLMPNSPSIPFFQQQAEIVRSGGSVIWNGSIRDTQRGISAALRGGVMRQFHPFPTMGRQNVNNFEYPFEFEETIPDFDSPTPGAFASTVS